MYIKFIDLYVYILRNILIYCSCKVCNCGYDMGSFNSLDLIMILIVATAFLLGANGNKLTPLHYSQTCPQALSIVKGEVAAAIESETRIGASLLRLHFHDCFVNVSSHTIGMAKCTSFRARIYNDTNTIEASFAKSFQRKCPANGNNGDNLAELDHQTPTHFDNLYFKNLLKKKGLLHSDQALFNGTSSVDSLVKRYANNNEAFFKAFAMGMIKMGNISPLTGNKGQVRVNCRKVN
ncbi:hypothetical protein F8388_023068 [Cannabis sativa]|uniref:peroxidase n=1 Tax=Cannabis sativa TaxID=3483 RepID=A0A7J6FET6_CANSA|nr:hypothetical protein F8388_023068 [Cannabis sativa]KAF4397821.1 hypothetical protein G4B88_017302 [Cannabis sativa]